MLLVSIGALSLLFGAALLLIVLIRKLPAIAELEPGRVQKISLPFRKLTQKINLPSVQRRILKSIEGIIYIIRSMLLKTLRVSERILRAAQTKSREMSGTHKASRILPSFLQRVRKRKAYLEEERKLIEWLTQHPEDVETYKRLGNLYSAAGNINDARAAFQQASKLDPEDQESKKRFEELASQ